jgi:thymidylate kinase
MFQTITIEGQDQVGKADATKELVKYLNGKGKGVTQVTYPYYALPIGSIIRQFLTDMDRLRNIKSVQSSFGQPREIEIIGTLFAINRLETLSTINKLFNNTESGYLISDRGPYSMAITCAYGVQSGVIKEEDIDRLIDLALDFDQTFRNALKSDDNIIQFRSKGEVLSVAQGDRKGDQVDVYENPKIQELSREIYKKYKERINTWNDIVTRVDSEEGSEWRPREDILSDVVNIIEQVNGVEPIENQSDFQLPDRITPDLVSKNQYGVDIGSSNMILLRNYANNGQKGKSFDIESDIGARIAQETSPTNINWDKESSVSISRMLEQYPEVFHIIDEFLGPDFRETFRQSVNRY